MIENDDILSVLKKSEEEKTDLLQDVLIAVQKAGTVFEAKKTGVDGLKKQSATAEDDIMLLLNNHIRRLETEKIELSKEVEAARDDLKGIDDLRVRVAESESELEKVKADLEGAVQEKIDANEKLVKIQAQWEKIAGG